jgi:hypothetical protein
MPILTKAWKLLLSSMITVQHVFRDKNTVANDLVQQASGFRLNQGKFGFWEKPNVLVFG